MNPFFSVKKILLYLFYSFSRVHNTVFKSLAEAVRESEIRKADPDEVMSNQHRNS